ncbi:MAG TPA: DUF3011 domain-containing protein [Longimicrobium sp.]
MIKTGMAMLAVATMLGLADRPAQAQTTVTCQSRDGRREVCRVDTRGGVQLVDRLSDRPCVQGRSWGYSRSGIWVDDGCRARFRVGYGSGYGGRYDDDRRDDNRRWDDNRRNNDWGDSRTVRGGTRRCEEAVAWRLRVPRSRIDAWVANNGRGNRNDRIYRWQGAGRQGTCRIERDGDVAVRITR